MKTILITGLDGSGKSTLLERISKKFESSELEIILLPHFDISKISDEKILKSAIFVNELSVYADIHKTPQLKAVALFSSMLLYQKIYSKIDINKTVIVERHPLIDTSVYAMFYAEKLFPGSIKDEILDEIDSRFSEEIKYISDLLPSGLISENYGKCSGIINFIYQHFHLEKKFDTVNLKQLFKTELPDKIYFLRAKPEILFDRIKNRKVLEAHENVDVFRKLDMVYSQIFSGLKNDNPEIIEEINADEIENLNEFFENFKL